MLLSHVSEAVAGFFNLDKVKYSITQVVNGEEIPILTFDTIEEFTVSATSNTTSYPIEAGCRVVDYKYSNPIVINIKGIVSRCASSGSGVFINPVSRDKKKLIANHEDTLEKLRLNMSLVNIRGRTGRHRKGYTLKQYTINEQLDNYYLFVVDMVFEEVKITHNQTSDPEKADTQNVGYCAVEELKT